MEYEKLVALIGSDFQKALDVLNLNKIAEIGDYKKEYKGDRKIRESQVGKRQDKDVGEGDNAKTVEVARIPINFQKKIVRSAAAFLFGSPVEISDENADALKLVMDIWDKNRLDNQLKKFCEMVKSETEGVFIFNTEDGLDNEGKKVLLLKIRLYGSENGTYSTWFDNFGDLKAFTWNFITKDAESKDIENAWVFTAETIYRQQKTSTGWAGETEKNQFQKIPIVYMSQEEPEWFIVKELIDQNEVTFSKFVDTNGYFASPIAKIFGEVESMPDKNVQGKAINIPQVYEEGKLVQKGDVEYLTWEQAPEAIKLENEISKDHIHSLTDTPDLSFNNVKGTGVTSGIALKLMFMGSILKAKWDEGDYAIVVERILTLIQAGLSNITLITEKGKFTEFNPSLKFTSILPENLAETVSLLSEAIGGKSIMAQETALMHNPLVDNADEEMKTILKEETQQLAEIVEP